MTPIDEPPFDEPPVNVTPPNFTSPAEDAIDDLWENSQGEYVVVDYKSTAKAGKIEALDKEWHAGYKRQMEIYQWLLRQKGYQVSNIGYFVYCNGKLDNEAFDARLEFDVTLNEIQEAIEDGRP